MPTKDGDLPNLPHDVSAERSVLGAVLLVNEHLSIAAERLRPSDFFDRRHCRVFGCMLEMAQGNVPIDDVTLSDRLRLSGELDLAGGAAYISALADGVPRVSNVGCHANIIREKALLRRVAHAAQQTLDTALKGKTRAVDLLEQASASLKSISGDAQTDTALFDTLQEFETAADPSFSIRDFLPDHGVTAIAGLAGHGKTFIALNIAAGLLSGPGMLWDLFHVAERATRIIYLIPEASRSVFKKRLQLMNLYDEVDKRLFVRTLTKGPTLQLTDRELLRAARGAHLICDTGVRFMRVTDENSAAEAAQGLSDDFFALLRAGARTVVPLFHSPKSAASQTVLSLEGTIRGSTELGAALSAAWGIRQIDREANAIFVENLKDRDFQACRPFVLQGRPHIDQTGSFKLLHRPGECSLVQAQPNRSNVQKSAERDDRINMAAAWLRVDRELTVTDLVARYGALNIVIEPDTARRYRKAALEKLDGE